ncbi:unnamed protein product [Psylliodes chrysocephalus]|uniref:ADP-ribosylation factor-like protein 2-binding protein n=1 Tax=Psylliodes chrysocephalus TaxID=3402493 RepID=A0A9P0CHS5_9CUCU|nr:unnamed protein product [Psylliodes chrysocephala]
MSDVLQYEDINDFNESADNDDRKFAVIIGCIEEIIVNENFNNLMDDFFDNYTVTPENEKLIYEKYIATVKKYIEEQLRGKLVNFEMGKFEEELNKRKHEVEDDVYEILASFKDFETFKNFYYEYIRDLKDRVASDISVGAVSILSYNNS